MTPRLFALRTAKASAADGEAAPATRRLHADHVGAEVGEEAAARLALLVGHVDDAQAGERQAESCRGFQSWLDMVMSP